MSPALLVEWTPWYQGFLGNLADYVLMREPVKPWISARPAPFWPDVFVAGGLPWRNLMRSALYHVFFVTVVWGFSVTWLQRPQLKMRSPFENSKLTYYSVSEYLPEVDTGSSPQPTERKGEPAYAKQRIISLPPAPDNFRQTLVTPNDVRLPQDVPLPNIVAADPIPAPVPEAALTHPRLTAPTPAVDPVAPPLDPSTAKARLRTLPAPDVVGPASDPNSATVKRNFAVPGPDVIEPPPAVESARARVRNLPQPAVVAPPVDIEQARRSIGTMSIAPTQIDVAAPIMPVSEQRPAILIRPGVGSAGSKSADRSAGPNVAPPTSVVSGTGSARQDVGRLITLSANPAPVGGPINIPVGSRHGEFAAGPEGRPGAPGTPDVRGSATGKGGNGDHSGKGNNAGLQPGISVSPGPTAAPAGVVVSGDPGQTPAPSAPARKESALMASLGPSRVADLARATRPGTSVAEPAKIEDRVFAGKKYYSMILNMPNLTSAGGSWIIRFAELHETKLGNLTAPVATLKVDPAYPAEAIRDRVEGTVTLYAVIRRDGSVGEVRVLRGVDDRLDKNARIALLRWHFRPAMKNGEAVDLEAVVQIPFIARRPQF